MKTLSSRGVGPRCSHRPIAPHAMAQLYSDMRGRAKPRRARSSVGAVREKKVVRFEERRRGDHEPGFDGRE